MKENNIEKEKLDIEIIEPIEHEREYKSRVIYTNFKSSGSPLGLFGTILFPLLLLLVSFLLVPALFIWIWAKVGLLKALLFGLSYFASMVIWNWLTASIISLSSRLILILRGKTILYISIATIAVSLIVNILLPWAIAGLFLGWFGWKINI